MSPSPAPQYLSLERAMDFIGDEDGVLTLLHTLHQTLGDDLSRIAAHVEAGDVQSANFLLHQLKGFVPVFCVDSLVDIGGAGRAPEQSRCGFGGAGGLPNIGAANWPNCDHEVATHLGHSSRRSRQTSPGSAVG